MADADPDAWLHIPCRNYLDFYRKGQYFREVLFITDCCRLGTAIDPQFHPFPDNRPRVGDVTSILAFATEDNHYALEPSASLNVSPADKKLSLFTQALLEGLEGVNVEPGGTITDKTVAQHVENVVPERAKQERAKQAQELYSICEHKQQPYFQCDTPRNIVFKVGKSTQEVLYSVIVFFPGNFNEEVELSSDRKDASVWDASQGPWELRLAAGRFRIRPKRGSNSIPFHNDGFFNLTNEGQHVQL